MKTLTQRLTVIAIFLFVLGFAFSQGQVMTAHPNDTTPVFLPYVPKGWPIPSPTPTPTVVPTLAAPIKLGPVGSSTGGDYFDDSPIGANEFPTYVYVHAGLLVDNVQMYLNTRALAVHGSSSGGDLNVVTLPPGEYITEVFGHAGLLVDQIGFKTNRGTVWGPWGGSGGDPFSMTAPYGYEIVGFWGYAGIFLDHLGVLARPYTGH